MSKYIYIYIYIYILALCWGIVSHRFRDCYGFPLFKEERYTFQSIECIQLLYLRMQRFLTSLSLSLNSRAGYNKGDFHFDQELKSQGRGFSLITGLSFA